LENEEIIEHFEEIEQKVDGLINVCKSLDKKNSELNAKINNMEIELQNKIEVEKKYINERNIILLKVNRILAKLYEIEDISNGKN